ncbi:hypothetical protein DICPUDRAFT_78725 [Dictyostelium purpureum]|uniref:CBS domain-containing protein n=1 Tax=Dictyostelium purpureum TaxID=5786 RepID=F0ZKD3_DICPU|nr:uncharacterized protein DICPUDRAFT_78725 [Dictyostelium purpureum]EGC35571.1 hypothetical protein DICPUDRAFT_78725 [Dictyostelium purpureum]|eukprot:XP_003287874.1 hypothetical protein DICPUDRAFT_78725 [Dictyostelium purpureum]
MESKRKGNTATENDASKKQKTAEVQDVKTALNTQVPQNLDGTQFLIKLVNTRAMSIKTRDEIIFSCERTDNLTKVFKGLIERGFLSVPVFQQTDKKKWYGFIDLLDIVRHVTTHFGKEKMSIEQDFWKLSEEEEKFKTLTVNDDIHTPNQIDLTQITQNYSLFSAFEIFARDPMVHRIPILDNMVNRHLVSILTQSQLIKFVYENLPLLGSKKDLLVKNMTGISMGNVITVESSTLAIDAFKILENKDVNGIAVVDGNGALIDNLSARDLKAIATDGAFFWKLYKPVEEFLGYLKTDSVTVRPRHAQFILESDTFETALTKIFTNSIHRLFIVDSLETKKPIGVISLSDLLLQLFP